MQRATDTTSWKLKEQKEKLLKKRVGGSSFLTPEAAQYLNDAIKKNQTKVDTEIVYAGLQNEKMGKMKFQRANKNQ